MRHREKTDSRRYSWAVRPLCGVLILGFLLSSGCGSNTASELVGQPPTTGGTTEIKVSISPSSAVIFSGQSRKFSASISGTNDNSVTWATKLGSVDSTGTYTAPQVTNVVTDVLTVSSLSAPSNVARASISVQPTSNVEPPGPYDITNQEPITDIPYTNGLTSRRLPADVMKKLMSNSDVLAATAITGSGSTPPTSWGESFVASPGNNDYNVASVYYASANDPIYCVSSCSHHPSNPSNNPVGKCFHAPSGIEYDGYVPGNRGAGDQNLLVWDQTQDKLFNAFYNSDENAILPACGGGQPCKISLQYCSWADRKNDPGYGNNPVYSNGLAPEAGTIRAQELIQGQINHAVYLNAYCTSGAVVFPNLDRSSSGLRCDQQGKSNADRPPNGALFFLDYTAAQIVAMSLPPWQKTILNAIATYGAYLGDTGGAHDTLHISHFEAGQAYRYYGIEDPL